MRMIVAALAISAWAVSPNIAVSQPLELAPRHHGEALAAIPIARSCATPTGITAEAWVTHLDRMEELLRNMIEGMGGPRGDDARAAYGRTRTDLIRRSTAQACMSAASILDGYSMRLRSQRGG